VLRSAGSLLKDAREKIRREEERDALRELRRARRMFGRVDSRSGLTAVLSLARSIKLRTEREEQKRLGLIGAAEADLRRLDARFAPERIEESRSHYLRRDSRKTPPSRRALRVTYIAGVAAIVILVALVVTLIVVDHNFPCHNYCTP